MVGDIDESREKTSHAWVGTILGSPHPNIKPPRNATLALPFLSLFLRGNGKDDFIFFFFFFFVSSSIFLCVPKTSTVLDLACRPGFAFGSTLHVLHLQLLVASDYRSCD